MEKITLITVCGCKRTMVQDVLYLGEPRLHLDMVYHVSNISPMFTGSEFDWSAGRQHYQTRRFYFNGEHNEEEGYIYREVVVPSPSCGACKTWEHRYRTLWDSMYKVEEHL